MYVGWHSCFVKENGTLLACGKGEYGRLGLGNERSNTEPSVVNPLDAPSPSISPSSTTSLSSSPSLQGCPVSLVSAGGSHTLLCTTGGRIYSVGRLDGGRCGVGLIRPGSDRVAVPQDITDKFAEQIEAACGVSSHRSIHTYIRSSMHTYIHTHRLKILQVCAGGSHSAVLVDVIAIEENNSIA